MKKQALIFAIVVVSAGIWAHESSHSHPEHRQMRGHGMMHEHPHSQGHAKGHEHDHLMFEGEEGPAHGQLGANGLRQGGPGMQRMMQGTDTTRQEETELALMFANHQLIEREVILLPDGIDTLTESSSPELSAVLVGHVMGMIQRADEGRDPGVSIQSATLDVLFEKRGTITTQIELTPRGIRVIQTSTDPEVVAALHTHSGEVTDMINRGMQAIHNRI